MFFSLIDSIRSALYKAVMAFGDLDGVGLQFAKQSADVVGGHAYNGDLSGKFGRGFPFILGRKYPDKAVS